MFDSCKKTQGLLFYGARSDFNPGRACYGIVITARCDLAQKKVKHVHFVTAITFEDWIKVECMMIVAAEQIKEAQNAIKKNMNELNLNSKLIEVFGPDKCRTVLLATEPDVRKRSTIEREIEKWRIADQIRNGKGLRDEVIESFWGDSSIQKKASSKIKLLVEHKLNGYYFLPKQDNYSELVVNFRDIQSMTVDGFEQLISKKIDCLELDERSCGAEIHKTFFLEKRDDFACDIAVIRSPAIEHLMQSFALLYSRIGLEDLDEEYKSELSNVQRILE